jgi:hypothetical protein
VVVEDNLTVVYINFWNNTRFGRFQSLLVVFGQDLDQDERHKILRTQQLVNG